MFDCDDPDCYGECEQNYPLPPELPPSAELQAAAAMLRAEVMPVLDRMPGRINHDSCMQGSKWVGAIRYDSSCATIQVEGGAKFYVSIRPGCDDVATAPPQGRAVDQQAAFLLRSFVQPPLERMLQRDGGQTGLIDIDRSIMRFTDAGGQPFSVRITPA